MIKLRPPEPEPEKPPAPTFEEFAAIFLDHCRANRLGVNTLMNYEINLRLYLAPVLGKRRLDQSPPSDITKIKSSLSAKSHNTACEVLKTLRRVFNVAIAQKHITGEPVALEIPRRLRKAVVAYDATQQAALLAAARELGPFYELVVLLGIDGGLRRGEIVGLQWSDINFGQGFLVVRHNIVRGKLDVPKGRTEDEVALTSRLTTALRAYQHDAGPYVLTNKHGRALQRAGPDGVDGEAHAPGGSALARDPRPAEDLRHPHRRRWRRGRGRGGSPPPQGFADREPLHRPPRRQFPRDQRAGDLMEA